MQQRSTLIVNYDTGGMTPCQRYWYNNVGETITCEEQPNGRCFHKGLDDCSLSLLDQFDKWHMAGL
jgi:hypothetical protein